MENPPCGKARNFQCILCPSSFKHKHNLTRHIRIHVNEKIFKCNQCAYKTVNNSHLISHVKAIHEKLTPFKCSSPGCNYKAQRNEDLKKHRRTHDPDPLVRRPFPCNYEGCDFRATQKSNLTRHIRRKHSENRVKSFVCSLCSGAFYNKHNLNVHINAIHVRESVHSCDKCSYKSLCSSKYRRLFKNKHGSVDEQVGQETPGRQPSGTSSPHGKQRNQDGANVETSDGPEVDQIQPEEDVMTAGISNDQEFWRDSLHIYQCCLCKFIAKSEEEALDHSTVHKDHLVDSH